MGDSGILVIASEAFAGVVPEYVFFTFQLVEMYFYKNLEL
jgi:hypothetical protein